MYFESLPLPSGIDYEDLNECIPFFVLHGNVRLYRLRRPILLMLSKRVVDQRSIPFIVVWQCVSHCVRSCRFFYGYFCFSTLIVAVYRAVRLFV